ncbi:hypothetical protein C0993_005415, partial [Termitomyces sp. T159_Od127]
IELLDGLIPGFKVVNTGSSSDSNSDPHRKIKPDPTMYKESVDTSNRKTKFDKAEMNIEFKRGKSSEPFVDESRSKEGHPFESQTNKGRHVRAQLTALLAHNCVSLGKSEEETCYAISNVSISDGKSD